MPALPLDLCLAGGEVTDPLVRPGGRWVSGVHTEDVGETISATLRMWSVDGSSAVDLLVDPTPRAGRGISGGVHAWSHAGDRLWVVTVTDGIVEVRIDSGASPTVATTAMTGERSWSTPSLAADGRSLYAIADWCELWCLDLHEGGLELVARADDGFMIDADGPSRRCTVWHRPHMSWTESAVLGMEPGRGVSVQQPRSSRDGGTRGFITDVNGTANVVIEPDAHSSAPTTIDDSCEHGGPVWGPGQRTWCPSPDGRRIAFTRNEGGFGSLWVLDRMTGERTMLGRGVHGCLSWEADTLAACRTGARTPPQVVVYDMQSPGVPARTILVEPADPRWKSDGNAEHLVEPVVHFVSAADGTEVPFRLFRAPRPHGGLIVWIHGGPIDQWQVTFRPRHAYWLSRGWSIAVVDHRGTTGWGRTYALALEGRWGEVDATDTIAVVDHLHREHGFSPGSTVVMGGSAGGLTALNVAGLVPDLVAGVVVSYPVVDLAEMLVGDDPFESHYMPRLIGTDSAGDAMIAARSPHLHAESMSGVPVLAFHGDADRSVPLVHSLRLQESMEVAGGSCRVVVFAGEGHGFKLRANIEREFIETEKFLASIAG